MESQAGAGGPTLTVPLRDGGSLTLARSTLASPGVALPITELAWIGLVPDPHVMPPDGSQQMGIGVRTRDNGAYYFVPAQSDDATRMLDAMFALRPALRDVAAPSAGAFMGLTLSPTGDAAGGGLRGIPVLSPRDPAAEARPGTGDNVLAGFAHVSILFAPVVTPLVVYLVARREAPYVERQAKQALVFQAIATVIYGTFAIGIFALSNSRPGSLLAQSLDAISLQQLSILMVLYSVLAILLGLFCLSWMNAALRAFQGKPYHYPFLGWL